MRDKMFERYYKRGFDHLMFKNVLGLKRPKKNTQIFYMSLMAILLAVGLIIS